MYGDSHYNLIYWKGQAIMRVSMVFFASSKRIDIPPGSHEVAVVSISTYTMIQYMLSWAINERSRNRKCCAPGGIRTHDPGIRAQIQFV